MAHFACHPGRWQVWRVEVVKGEFLSAEQIVDLLSLGASRL
jgi:hypothetical protein